MLEPLVLGGRIRLFLVKKRKPEGLAVGRRDQVDWSEPEGAGWSVSKYGNSSYLSLHGDKRYSDYL